MPPVRSFLIVFVCAALTALLAGCATPGDEDRLSERPWNTPKTWEYGIPTQMLEER
ncbi:MAG: hypothetical protein N3G20_01090 [Verrucomicrobiae bacterium]|nr:hypothetical protein [Verrucomicrobiae bacterium]